MRIASCSSDDRSLNRRSPAMMPLRSAAASESLAALFGKLSQLPEIDACSRGRWPMLSPEA
eukprot:2004909-Prymnesium_polylepis.1